MRLKFSALLCLLPALAVQATCLFPAGAAAQGAQAAAVPPAVAGSGLPVPRFVSLKADRVYARQGPGTDHKVLWEYRRAGLPVEVIREFEGWRQVRDSDGTEGWIVQTLISGRRTALITPWEVKGAQKPQVELHADASVRARAVAIVEAGVIANIRTCDTRWCFVSVGDFRGYVEQKRLWGVYPGERIR